jgi:hypothetical protein
MLRVILIFSISEYTAKGLNVKLKFYSIKEKKLSSGEQIPVIGEEQRKGRYKSCKEDLITN